MNSKIKTMTTCALFAAIMCICGPLSVPIGPVPVSLTNLVLYFAIMILDTKKSFVSYLLYLLIGIVGLPVFSGFQGGLGKVVGPTGGYLVGFLLMVIIGGIIMEKTEAKIWITILGMILGTIVCYAFGTVWFMAIMDYELMPALALCVWPFIPFDLVKIVIAVLAGKVVRKRLETAGVL